MCWSCRWASPVLALLAPLVGNINTLESVRPFGVEKPILHALRRNTAEVIGRADQDAEGQSCCIADCLMSGAPGGGECCCDALTGQVERLR